jgi:hypothetical protein
MDIPCIYIRVDIHGLSMDIACISTNYIHGISMDIHGISFDVYTWYIRGISMDIPSILKPDFAAGLCCWSHPMRTCVWVIKSVLFHAPPWQLCQGKMQRHKRLNLTAAKLEPPPSVAGGLSVAKTEDPREVSV